MIENIIWLTAGWIMKQGVWEGLSWVCCISLSRPNELEAENIVEMFTVRIVSLFDKCIIYIYIQYINNFLDC